MSGEFNCIAWHAASGNMEIRDTRGFRRIVITPKGNVSLYPFGGESPQHLEGKDAAQVIPQLTSMHPPIQSPKKTAQLTRAASED